MHPVRHIPRYTYADYLLWEGDWEMIEGIPYAMSPSAGGRHQWLASLLTTEIVLQLRKHHDQCGHCISVQDVDWRVDDHTVLRPDLAVICTPLVDDYIVYAPSIIIEIISPTSGHRDRIIKREIYEERGVKYYAIVDPIAGLHITYLLEDGQYKESAIHTFVIHEDCNIEINIAEVMAKIKK